MSDSLMIASDESAVQNPNLELAHNIFLIENRIKINENADDMIKIVLDNIIADSMATFYPEVCLKFGQVVDEDKLKIMIEANKISVEDLEKKIVDATENSGDTEVLDAMFNKARFFSKVGDWTSSFAAYDDILKRVKLSTGKKIDATMEKARISFFLTDYKNVKLLINEAKKFIDLGGDWDRRNR
jgi:26S proteasome regulatory subunit N7